MTTRNPSNPYTGDAQHTQKEVPLPVQKARVLEVVNSADGGFHAVRIKIYGDDSPAVAPVLTPVMGSVWVPKAGTDVAVIYGSGDKPWVLGSWYAVDRVQGGSVDLPDYEVGDLRLGNQSGSGVTVHDDGHISIKTVGRERVDIDHQSASVHLGTDFTFSSTDTYETIPFDVVDDDPEALYNPDIHGYGVRYQGLHRVSASVEIASAGQGILYTLGIFNDGTLIKRVRQQSSINEPLTLNIDTQRRFDAGTTLNIKLMKDGSSSRTVRGQRVSTEFNIRRKGI